MEGKFRRIIGRPRRNVPKPWTLGQRVMTRYTTAAKKAHIHNGFLRGKIVGASLYPGQLSVLWDGLKHPKRIRIAYIRPDYMFEQNQGAA